MKYKGAGTIIENSEGKILVLHRLKNVRWGNKWCLPGGNIKPGLSPIKTAIKKTFGETGFTIPETDLQIIKRFFYEVNSDQVEFYVYKYSLKNGNPEIKLNPKGHDNFLWDYPENFLKRKDLVTGLYVILKFVILHK